jgi:hypothetical protein
MLGFLSRGLSMVIDGQRGRIPWPAPKFVLLQSFYFTSKCSLMTFFGDVHSDSARLEQLYDSYEHHALMTQRLLASQLANERTFSRTYLYNDYLIAI